MSKNLKYFLIPFVLSFPFWWGINIFQQNTEDFFFDKELMAVQAIQLDFEQKLIDMKPIRNFSVADLEIGANSVLSFLSGKEKNLFEKNIDKKLAIASLTKLMTASIILENYDMQQIVEISNGAAEKPVAWWEEMLRAGEKFYVRDLFYSMLIESNNSASYALAEMIGEEEFVRLMNLEAEKIGMENTYFYNSSGLEPDDLGAPLDQLNYSTAQDLLVLTQYLLEKYPVLWEILSLPEFDLYMSDGRFHHKVTNTNEFLNIRTGDISWEGKIIGGKTGYTDEAGECFILIVKAPRNRYFINIILGTQDRFSAMEELINWLNAAYKW